VLLKSDYFVIWPEAGLLNKCSFLALDLGETNLQIRKKLFWSHFVVLLKSDLDVQQTRVRFVEKGLMLSSNFRCKQINKYEIFDFGHTWLCYLSQT
jgi:hypothetical protein